jgi:protein-disulfide isomerase
MKKFFGTMAVLPLTLLLAAPLGAQVTPKEEGITREQANQILEELRNIRQLLEKQNNAAAPKPAGPAKATLNMTGAEMLGSKTAPLTMVEFTDYQCPFCQRFHTTVFGEIKKNYIDTGKVRFYSRDLPLDSMHPNAIRAAQAARCAAEQGQFWALRDIMGANPSKLDLESLVADAASLKMDTEKFRSCVASEKYKQAIQTDVLEAMKIGADGTPTFVIGKSTADGVDGEVLVGAMPYEVFDRKLKTMEAK